MFEKINGVPTDDIKPEGLANIDKLKPGKKVLDAAKDIA